MRPLADADNSELLQILEQLLHENVDISAREVIRRHSTLKHATAITRNEARTQLVAEWKDLQTLARSIAVDPAPAKGPSLGQQLDESKVRIKQLEGQVRALVASHAACVRAVYKHGGARSLQKFWTEYDQIGQTLRELGAVPESAEVLPFPTGE